MKDFFVEHWNNFVDFLYSLVLTVQVMLKDLFFFITDTLMAFSLVIADFLGSFLEGLDITQYIDALPIEVASIMSLIGIGEATGMVVTCLVVRLILQLIPFVRLGS